MINEVLDEIRATEEECARLMKQAAEEAKQAVLHADEECRNIRLNAIRNVKDERRKVVEEANRAGDAKAAKIISAGRVAAQSLAKNTDRGKAAEFVKNMVLSAYVSR